MNKTALYISIGWLVSIILFCGLTYWLSHSKPIPTYTQDYVLRKQYDSLMVEAQKKEVSAKYLQSAIDSVIKFSASQQFTIDSLIKYKIQKKIRDEKSYQSVSSLSDSAINARLSDKLKK